MSLAEVDQIKKTLEQAPPETRIAEDDPLDLSLSEFITLVAQCSILVVIASIIVWLIAA